MKGRYDYVRYDGESTAHSTGFKAKVEELQKMTDDHPVQGPRVRLEQGVPNHDQDMAAAHKAAEHYRQLATDALETFFMNVGKLIRTSQVLRGGNAADVPERTNG